MDESWLLRQDLAAQLRPFLALNMAILWRKELVWRWPCGRLEQLDRLFHFFFYGVFLSHGGSPSHHGFQYKKGHPWLGWCMMMLGTPHDYYYLWNLHIISHYTLHFLFSTAQLSQLSRPGTIWWLCELCAAHHRQLHCQWRAEAGALVKQQRKVTMKICTPRSKLLVGQHINPWQCSVGQLPRL